MINNTTLIDNYINLFKNDFDMINDYLDKNNN